MEKIVINGVDHLNKGAELMLYAILDELEKSHPDCICYLPYSMSEYGLDKIKTSICLKRKPGAWLIDLSKKLHLRGFLRKLDILPPSLDDMKAVKGADYFLDASGLLFSDKMKVERYRVRNWCRLLRAYHRQGTKVVLLPQTFGPAQRTRTKILLGKIGKYADLVFPRDHMSNVYLDRVVPDSKIHICRDFTSTIGTAKEQRSGVCIIPNKKMISSRTCTEKEYLDMLETVARMALDAGKTPFLLNHEGPDDLLLCKAVSQRFSPALEIKEADNALEIKDIISRTEICVSSRFHGCASALSTAVPCIGTSWGHKYIELFNDHNLSKDHILNVSDPDFTTYRNLLEDSSAEHEMLLGQIEKHKKQIADMWTLVWKKKK